MTDATKDTLFGIIERWGFPTLVAVAIGWFLDGWLGTRPWLLMLFFVLGGAAGVANVWRLVSPPKPPAK